MVPHTRWLEMTNIMSTQPTSLEVTFGNIFDRFLTLFLNENAVLIKAYR